MRFRLLMEAPENNPHEYIDIMMDDTASREDRLDAWLYYLQNRGHTRLLNILQKNDDRANKLFDTLLIAFSYEQDVKTKLEFILSKVPIEAIDAKNYPNFITLCDTLKEVPDFDHKQQYLSNPSLYNRSAQDFGYTLKVMDIVHNQSKLVKYYDPKKIDIKYLYDGNRIKPAGIMMKNPEDFDTIYGVLELWKETSANENTPKSNKKNSSIEEPNSDDKSGKSDSSKKDGTKVYASFKDAEKVENKTHGNTITINGKFMYDTEVQDWVPVKK